MAPPDLKKMITIKLKPRKDPYSDQFSRIVMVKMMMLTAGVTAISWAQDKFSCIVPKAHDLDAGFVGKACWINGVYIYENLPINTQGYYYGIPKSINIDGKNPVGDGCDVDGPGVKNCEPLQKTFYLQYQWFPLGVAALGFLYYLPYLFYCVVNADLLGIKDLIKKKKPAEVNYDEILQKYFLRKNNSSSMLNSRIILNVIVKVCYVITNVVSILVVDLALNHRFLSYGSTWRKWAGLETTDKYDYTHTPRSPKAGHGLLPAFGICQVQNSAEDEIRGYKNKHVYVCELSQHILYQYILIILWYMLVAGIVISIFGLLKHIFDSISSAFCVGLDGEEAKAVYGALTLRERQYMDYMRRKNMPAFAEFLPLLIEAKGLRRRNHFDNSSEAANESKLIDG